MWSYRELSRTSSTWSVHFCQCQVPEKYFTTSSLKISGMVSYIALFLNFSCRKKLAAVQKKMHVYVRCYFKHFFCIKNIQVVDNRVPSGSNLVCASQFTNQKSVCQWLQSWSSIFVRRHAFLSSPVR